MSAGARPQFEPAIGRYLRLDIQGKPHRLYVEQAGAGIPLVCLHTAGADSRQYRGLLNDAEVLAKFRVIAFDLPWHGKSSPPAGWQTGEYKLTSRAYVETIMAVVDALGLVAGRDMLPPAPPAPVVPLGLADVVLTGSLTNFSLSSCTRMSCLPMPRKPPTPITTPSIFPDLSSRISLMSPSFSFWSL